MVVACAAVLPGPASLVQAQTEIPDSWFITWFGELNLYGAGDDPDKDGLSNLQEYNISSTQMNPASWDTDGDGLDDRWEWIYCYTNTYITERIDPRVANAVTYDSDGDGLSQWLEYCGADGYPRMRYASTTVLPNGSNLVIGKVNSTVDDLNPLDIDTDGDLLLDSFELAWYDPNNGLDPVVGDGTATTGTIARADTDQDGLSNYREQCLLPSLREGGANEDKWLWEGRLPFSHWDYDVALEGESISVRVVPLSSTGQNLDLDLEMDLSSMYYTNRFQLRNHEWTDPTDSTGYNWVDEDICAGHDTDNDTLPDGWEVEFGLDPRDPGTEATGWTNGPWGDPDGDGRKNLSEYQGQDTMRNATRPYINGNGDETNPNQKRWRPDSTYLWRWFPTNAPYDYLTSPRAGYGYSRIETLGAECPTAPLTNGANCINTSGYCVGDDSDDDGIADADEIISTNGMNIPHPAYSCSPFIKRSALITSAAGIPIPDPEPSAASVYSPSGFREDLQFKDWTIECMVKITTTNVVGDLFNFVTRQGPSSQLVYRFSLSNGCPVLTSQYASKDQFVSITANPLPTNQWIHLAGVWDTDNNALSLYIDGVVAQQMTVVDNNAGALMYPATNALALAVSANGSFVNQLYLDEVRIWQIARPAALISEYANRVVPQGCRDDVWVGGSSGQTRYYEQYDTILINGGSLFDGEQGQVLDHVLKQASCANYWIDTNTNGVYNQHTDILLHVDAASNAPNEGQIGVAVSPVYYNDKDGSGDFTSIGLLAYYRFDDGGTSAEDFTRKAKNGLLGSISESYRFGDHGYALTTNNFQWITSGAAVVYGATSYGSDDSDEDGMDDAWETTYNLDPFDNGTEQETASGLQNGPFGPDGDPDGDSLKNLYEYHAGTNPRAKGSGDDGQKDYDSDNLVNITEQNLGCRPDIVDTDDDGMPDNIEQGNRTSPINPLDPPVSRSMTFGGVATDYVEVPQTIDFSMQNWTIEAAVQPTDAAGGTIVRRAVQQVSTGVDAMNYYMALEPDGSGGLRLVCGYVQLTGSNYLLRGGSIPIGTTTWTYVAATYSSDTATLSIYLDGSLVTSTNNLFMAPPRSGKGGENFVRIGESFAGNLDEIRLWNYARSESEIQEALGKIQASDTDGLVAYFPFNDGQATTNYFPFGAYHQPQGPQNWCYPEDWNDQWQHAGVIHGNAAFLNSGAGVLPALVYVYLAAAADTPVGYWEVDQANAGWMVDDVSQNWQESGHSVALEVGDEYLLRFAAISGWAPPANVTLTITNSDTIYLTNYYDYVGASSSGAYCVSGEILNHSTWTNGLPPPGDGSQMGQIVVGVWSETSDVIGKPFTNQTRLSRTACLSLPSAVDYGIGPLPELSAYDYYQIIAWIDGDADFAYDPGEPCSKIITVSYSELPNGVVGCNLTIVDDSDEDDLPDWWEIHCFGDLDETKTGDYDQDGLTNYQEYNIPLTVPAIIFLDAGRYDSDSDGMDDQWEYERYNAGHGLNPSVDDAWADPDGDGLFNLQEYNGVDGEPRLKQDSSAPVGVALSASNSVDDLNPCSYDSDGDALVDSFEFAWYDASAGIDPATNNAVNIAADLDADGMATYREQCLLAEFAEGGANDIWSYGTNALPAADAYGVLAFNPPLNFMASGVVEVAVIRSALYLEGWTSPVYTDTDGDLLPDGWEVQYNLNPKSALGNNGYGGDPDGDQLINYQEYLGQDALRSTNQPTINGTGDETNPYQYNWIPASTGPGAGIVRPAIPGDYWNTNLVASTNGTLGAGRPTISLGAHGGLDTDDDGLADYVEIQQEYYNSGTVGSSPVHSMSPFIKRAAMITNAAGIRIPDPEGAANGYSPFLHGANWTIECYVKVSTTNSTGWLINNSGPNGTGQISYRLALTNNVPVLSFDTVGGARYSVTGPSIPTNRWVYLAGVWNAARNSLDLYVDGVFVQDQRIYEGALSGYLYASYTNVTLGASADGSFVNTLMMDEIRIWTVARTADEIEAYRTRLVPQTNAGLKAYFRFDDGGATAEDFAAKAKNTQLGASSTNFYYGDMGYALSGGFCFVTNDYAGVRGVDWRGADDSDGDGLPDAWEMINHLDPFSTNGVNGAEADPDTDGLKNSYEYWSDTNPWQEDTDANGVLDRSEDRDGDTVVNGIEQQLLSRPDLIDTDDDGLTDNEERNQSTNPADPVDPVIGRAIRLGGSASDYLDVPSSSAQRLLQWTLEAWVNPDSAAGGAGALIRRAVQNLGGGVYAENYTMGLRANGSGGLQLYAGYTLLNGTSYYVAGGGAVTNGVWTHVAAAYDSATATLNLFMNGVLIATSNALNNAPPINGRGGDTFMRIGEDIAGRLDDVRIWSVARTTNQISANMHTVIDGATAGLVNYFRMDDSQAVTNAVPFGPYHQPFGAQDFTVTGDWSNQWEHAAMPHGSASFVVVESSGPVVIPPTVQVVLLPAAAVTGGAQWSLNGGAWNNSEAIVTATAGVNAVTFRSVDGWVTPQSLSLSLSNSMTVSTNVYYTQGGAIQIDLDPSEAVSAGATWRVDGGTWQASEAVVSNLSPGSYYVEYSSLTNWTAPGSEYVTVLEGETTALVRIYQSARGSLRVTISPMAAVTAGAQWRVNSNAWQNSGVAITLSSGTYTVDYRNVEGWLTPQTVAFDVTNSQAVALTATYYQYQIIGSFGYGEGQFNRPGGLAADRSGNLYISDTGNNRIQILRADGTWGVLGGSGTALGQFNQPYGLTVGGDGRLYIADANNHRIQCYNTFDQSWTAWGGSMGSAQGQFNAPFDVALDNSGNLYVADRSNHRVQKKTTDNVWSTFIASGFANGQVRFPRGLAADSRGYLYVSDYLTGSPGTGRVQRFTWSGLFADVTAASATNQGLIGKIAGMDVAGTNSLYMADNLSNSLVLAVLSAGTITEALGTNVLSGPEDVAADRYGNIYVADTKHHRIIKLFVGDNTSTPTVQTNQYHFRNDFDGDGKTDKTVFWNTGGWWYMHYSTGGTDAKQLGAMQDIPACGDYDGDGKTDQATFRRNDGLWLIQLSSGGRINYKWGWSETVPVPGDYDGDGVTDICVYWPAGGTWFIQFSQGGSAARGWGWSDTLPISGDFDGDGLADLTVYWPEQGKWFICASSTMNLQLLSWGWSEVTAVPGDYDGDGRADAAVYYPPSGFWLIHQSSDSTMYSKMWGWSESIPVPGDYDGDGKTDVGVFYPDTGYWLIWNSGENTATALNWGWWETCPIY